MATSQGESGEIQDLHPTPAPQTNKPRSIQIPSSINTDASTFATFLAECGKPQRNGGSCPPTVYIHPKIISFKDSLQKANWTGYLDFLEQHDTMVGFMRAPKRGGEEGSGEMPRIWLALFTTPSGNEVHEQQAWKDMEWHCWAAAIVRTEEGKNGKDLLIFDVDADAEHPSQSRERELFRGVPGQTHLVSAARDAISKSVRIWISLPHKGRGEDRCVFHTCDWLVKALSCPPRQVATGGGDDGEGDTAKTYAGFEQVVKR
jgi:hypothetical protein